MNASDTRSLLSIGLWKFDKKINNLFKLSDSDDISYASHVRFFGLLYFSELFLIWIISGTHTPHKFYGLELMKCQSFTFFLGGLIYGLLSIKVSKFRLLNSSLVITIIGSLITLFFTFFEIDNLFSLGRLISCLGLAGGIGINLVTVAFKKNLEPKYRSRGIALFSAFGSLGTVMASILLYVDFYGHALKIVLFLGILSSIIAIYNLNYKSKKEIVDIKLISFSNLRNQFMSVAWKVIQMMLLGLPTFYITSLLATNSLLFKERMPGINSDNISAFCLGLEYLGMFAGYIILCFWSAKKWGAKYKNIGYLFGEDPVFNNRKNLLIGGSVLQVIFLIVLFFTKISGIIFLISMFIGSIGVGNWAIILMLITEQKEFSKYRYLAACFIPNLIRFGLVMLLWGQKELTDVFIDNPALENLKKEILTNPTYTNDKDWLGLFLVSWVLYFLIFLAFTNFKETGDQELNSTGPIGPNRAEIFSQRLFAFFNNVKEDVKTRDSKMTIANFLKQKFSELKTILEPSLITKEGIIGINFYFQVFNTKFQKPEILESGFSAEELKNERVNLFNKKINIESTTLIKIALETNKKYALIYKFSTLDGNNVLIKPDVDSLCWNLDDENMNEFFNEFQITEKIQQKSLIQNRETHNEIFNCEPSKDYFTYFIRPQSELENFDIGVLFILYEPLKEEYIDTLRLLLDFLIMSVKIDSLGREVSVLNSIEEYEKTIISKFNRHEVLKVGNALRWFVLFSSTDDKRKYFDSLFATDPEKCLFELEAYIESLKDNDKLRNNFLLTKRRFNDNLRRQRLGLSNLNEISVEQNNINTAIIALISEVCNY
ncbi:MAG: MFS transporter [Saprospiraceae bacterium]|nr:MFS transporter [Saprospiraceae bacterium]